MEPLIANADNKQVAGDRASHGYISGLQLPSSTAAHVVVLTQTPMVQLNSDIGGAAFEIHLLSFSFEQDWEERPPLAQSSFLNQNYRTELHWIIIGGQPLMTPDLWLFKMEQRKKPHSKGAHYNPATLSAAEHPASLVRILDIMTLCCSMTVRGYISNGPQATSLSVAKDTHPKLVTAFSPVIPEEPESHWASGAASTPCHHAGPDRCTSCMYVACVTSSDVFAGWAISMWHSDAWRWLRLYR